MNKIQFSNNLYNHNLMGNKCCTGVQPKIKACNPEEEPTNARPLPKAAYNMRQLSQPLQTRAGNDTREEELIQKEEGSEMINSNQNQQDSP